MSKNGKIKEIGELIQPKISFDITINDIIKIMIMYLEYMLIAVVYGRLWLDPQFNWSFRIVKKDISKLTYYEKKELVINPKDGMHSYLLDFNANRMRTKGYYFISSNHINKRILKLIDKYDLHNKINYRTWN